MEQSYDDLVGGGGRSVYFRPKRYQPHALLRQLPGLLEVGGTPVKLQDFSMSGVCYQLDGAEAVPPNGAVFPLRLSVGEVTAFSGRGEVVRTQSDFQRTKVAVRLLDDVIEPAAVKLLHDKLVLEEAIRRGTDVFHDISEEYKRVCADAALFLNYWRALLDDCENDLMRSPGGEGWKALRPFEEAAEQRMRSEWAEIRRRANEAVTPAFAREDVFVATKRYTEMLVTPLLMPAPIWQRAYEKPRGYAGDFRLMNYMYDPSRRGDTAFARILHQLGREERLCATVPTRKDLLVRHIREAVSQGRSELDTPVRITSVGAGPAREIVEYLETSPYVPKIVFSLIDQDEEALSYAHQRIHRAALQHDDRVDVKCRYIAFRQLLARKELLAEMRGQDLVYSAGLLDYLTPEVARMLVTRLFDLVGREGALVFGNAAADAGVKWVPEFLLDWHMNYRSAHDMHELTSDLDESAKVLIESDPSDAWLFLVARRC